MSSPHRSRQDREARQLEPRQAAYLLLFGFHFVVETIELFFAAVYGEEEEPVVRFRPTFAPFDEFLRKRKIFVFDEFADRIGESRDGVVDVDVNRR